MLKAQIDQETQVFVVTGMRQMGRLRTFSFFHFVLLLEPLYLLSISPACFQLPIFSHTMASVDIS